MKKIIVICLVFLSVGCSTKIVSMQRDVPAEINLSRFDTITIDSVKGPYSSDLSMVLKNKLSQSKHFKFVMNSEKNSGQLLEVSAEIIDKNFDQSFSNAKGTCWSLSKTYKCRLYTTNASWSATTMLQLTDGNTGEMFKQIRISKKHHIKKEVEGGYIRYGSDRGFSRVIKKIANSFSDMIQPHKEKVKVNLFEDKEIPDLKKGIDFAKKRDWITAAKYFEKAIELVKTKTINSKATMSEKLLSDTLVLFNQKKDDGTIFAATASKAYYAYGVALGYGGIDYDAAIENIDHALALHQDVDYTKERLIIQNFKKDADELLEQGYK